MSPPFSSGKCIHQCVVYFTLSVYYDDLLKLHSASRLGCHIGAAINNKSSPAHDLAVNSIR